MGVTVVASGGDTTGSSTVWGGRQHFAAEGAIGVGPDIVVGSSSGAGLQIYAAGLGTRYSGGGSPGICFGVAYTSAGNYLAATSYNTSPYIQVRTWLGTYGSIISTTGVTLPTGQSYQVAFTAAGDYLAVAHDTSPYVTVWPWTGAYGSKMSNPGTAVTASGRSVRFSPSGDAIFITSSGSPYIQAYPWDGSGFGSRVSDPGTLPAGAPGQNQNLALSPDGAYVSVAHAVSPYISTYPWSSGAFGTRVSTTGVTLPTATGQSPAYSPSGDVLLVGHSTSPNITAWPWTGAYGSKYANPATAVGFTPNATTFDSAGETLYLTGINSIGGYLWSAGFGSRLSSPAVGLSAQGNALITTTRYIT